MKKKKKSLDVSSERCANTRQVRNTQKGGGKDEPIRIPCSALKNLTPVRSTSSNSFNSRSIRSCTVSSSISSSDPSEPTPSTSLPPLGGGGNVTGKTGLVPALPSLSSSVVSSPLPPPPPPPGPEPLRAFAEKLDKSLFNPADPFAPRNPGMLARRPSLRPVSPMAADARRVKPQLLLAIWPPEARRAGVCGSGGDMESVGREAESPKRDEEMEEGEWLRSGLATGEGCGVRK